MTDIKKRGGHRAIATRCINEVNFLLQATCLDSKEIATKILGLKRQQTKILEFDEKVQNELDDEDLASDMMESHEVVQAIDRCIVAAEDAIASSNSAATSQGSSVLTKPQVVKLPVIQLPTFSGNPLDWQHFWDLFHSLVDSRTDLAGSQKFNYLNGQLKGEALKLLEGFSPTDLHYASAVKLLKDTYGDSRVIIQAHLHSLFDLECLGVKSEDISTFRSSFECHIRGLEALGTRVKEAGFVLVALLLRKLPNKICDNINRTAKSSFWELDDFRLAINAEIKLLQATIPSIPKGDKKEPGKSKAVNSSPSRSKPSVKKMNYTGFKSGGNKDIELKSSAGNFNVVASSKGTGGRKVNAKSSSYKCSYCFDSHDKWVSCQSYPTVADRLSRAKNLQLCLKCLRREHDPSSNCAVSSPCFNCKAEDHHTTLCPNPKSDNSTVTSTTIFHTGINAQGIALPTAILSVITGNQVYKVRALFDQGAQRSFLLQTVVDRLQMAKVGRTQLTIQGFGSVGKPHSYETVSFTVKTSDGNVRLEALVTKELPKQICMPGISDAIDILKRLNVNLADPDINADTVGYISMLIGADQYYKFVKGHKLYKGIHVITSNLGDMVTGCLPQGKTGKRVQVSTVAVLSAPIWESENSNLENLWKLDAIGINPNEATQDDAYVVDTFNKSLSFADNRYTVGLPWRRDHPELPSNYGVAKARLINTLTKLRSNARHLKIYDEIIQDQLKRGFIEPVAPGSRSTGKVHYLSHHAVKKDSVTTPLRIVFDCSAGSPSLNDCLHSGPPMINELARVLLRFRLGKWACVGDIAKAYLMIQLRAEDKDVTRFLWSQEPANPDGKLVTYRFRVVLFGATCSQYLLNATVQHHLGKYGDVLSETQSRNLYVDNL